MKPMSIPNLEADTASFVLDCRSRLQNILQRLEWSEEGVLKNFNTNSLAVTHIEPSKQQQTPAAEVRDYPASCPTNNSLVLVTPDLQKLLQNDKVEAPKNFHDLQANFSREQKLQIYEHVIQNTKKLDNNTVDKVPDGEQSLAEIVAENKREANRKKRKFRIAKPTRIEEVRAVVELQMQSLQQFIRKQKEVGGKNNTSMKEKHPHGIDATNCVKDSKRSLHRGEYSNSYSDGNGQTKEKYKSHTSSANKYEERWCRSNCARERESSTKSYKRLDRKHGPSRQYEKQGGKSPRRSGNSDRKLEYERHKRSLSRSPTSRKSHKHKDSETYLKRKDGNESHKRKRSKSLELDKKKKLDKVRNEKLHKDRNYPRRSRSREKHRHNKKKHKTSRSRSRESRDYSKRDANEKDNLRQKRKR